MLFWVITWHVQLTAWPALPRVWCHSQGWGRCVWPHRAKRRSLRGWQENSGAGGIPHRGGTRAPVVGRELPAAVWSAPVDSKGPGQNEMAPRNNAPSWGQGGGPSQTPLEKLLLKTSLGESLFLLAY